jgi:hypothetical protein
MPSSSKISHGRGKRPYNPTTSLDLEAWLMSLSVRQESPVVSLLYPCHQPKRLSNRVCF